MSNPKIGATSTNPFCISIGATANNFDVTGAITATTTITATGDVAAAGGFKRTVGPFTATLAASQTALATTFGLAGAGGWVAPRAGSLTALTAMLDAAITGSTKTAIPGVYKNGTIVNAAAIVTFTTGGAETTGVLAIAKDTYAFAAGDVLDVRYTSTAISNTPKLWACIEVEC